MILPVRSVPAINDTGHAWIVLSHTHRGSLMDNPNLVADHWYDSQGIYDPLGMDDDTDKRK